MRMGVALLVACCLWVSTVQGYSTGPPEAACGTRLPQHGGIPQTSECPYHIDAQNWVPGEKTDLVLYGDNDKPFKGFLVSAQHPTDHHLIGRMEVNMVGHNPDAQVKTACNGTSLTHADSTDKQFVIFSWAAPADLDPHTNVIFRFSVVHDMQTYWKDCNSFYLTVNEDYLDSVTETTTPEPTTTTATTTTTTRTTTTTKPTTTKRTTTTPKPTTTTTTATTTTTRATTTTSTTPKTTTTTTATTTTPKPTTTTRTTTTTTKPTTARTSPTTTTTTSKPSTTTTKTTTMTTTTPKPTTTTTTTRPTTTTSTTTRATPTTTATTPTTTATTLKPTTKKEITTEKSTAIQSTQREATTQPTTQTRQTTTTTQPPTTTSATTRQTTATTTTQRPATITTTAKVLATKPAGKPTTAYQIVSGGSKPSEKGSKYFVSEKTFDSSYSQGEGRVDVPPTYVEKAERDNSASFGYAVVNNLQHVVVSETECTEAGNRYVVIANTNCRRFRQIWSSGSAEFDCPAGLFFDAINCACSWSTECKA